MKYKSNYITYAICRISFPNILDFNQFNPPKDFQKKVSSDFPLLNVQNSDISDNENEWIFSDKNGINLVAISNTYLHIEFTEYNTFEQFYECIRKMIEYCKELYNLKHITQVELRYINEISFSQGNPFNWQNLINKKLLFDYSYFVDEKHKTLKSMQTFEFIKNDNKIVFNFGLPNSEYPEPISRREFVLDYEASYDYVIEIHEVFDKIIELNDVITILFEKSVEDELRTIMGIVDYD